MQLIFEQGPKKPPSEAHSLSFRFTRNCPWNKCIYCPVYKGKKFSRRSLKEIKQDIDNVAWALDDISAKHESIAGQGRSRYPKWNQCLDQYRLVSSWLYQERRTVFIEDADSMIMKTKDLIEALKYIKSKVPGVKRIAMYARSNTLRHKSLGELQEIRGAGLGRLHVGLESGSNQVLELVRKGCTAEQHVQAGKKVLQSGITLSVYVMPGLGGRRLSREHAMETARALNEMNPHIVRLRNLQVFSGTELDKMIKQGYFQPLSKDELKQEYKLFLSLYPFIFNICRT